MTAPTLGSQRRVGLAMRFLVVVDGLDLGYWQKCSGLSVGFEVMEELPASNYENPVILPTRLKYTPISLQRAMNETDSARVQKWLRMVVREAYSNNDDQYDGGTAKITLFDAYAAVVASWSLRHVYPRNWKGPDLDAGSSSAALETLELVHQGFL